MIRALPSTVRVSLPAACRMSRVLAFATASSAFSRARVLSWSRNCSRSSATSARADQTAGLAWSAKPRIVSPYRRIAAVTILHSC